MVVLLGAVAPYTYTVLAVLTVTVGSKREIPSHVRVYATAIASESPGANNRTFVNF